MLISIVCPAFLSFATRIGEAESLDLLVYPSILLVLILPDWVVSSTRGTESLSQESGVGNL